MADAQKAESTPSPDTEGVGLELLTLALAAAHDELSGSPTKAVTAIQAGVDMCRDYWRHIAKAALRTAQNTGRDEVLEDGDALVIQMAKAMFAVSGADFAWEDIPEAREGFIRYAQAALNAAQLELLKGAEALAALSSTPVSTVDEEGGGA